MIGAQHEAIEIIWWRDKGSAQSGFSRRQIEAVDAIEIHWRVTRLQHHRLPVRLARNFAQRPGRFDHQDPWLPAPQIEALQYLGLATFDIDF